MLDPKFVLLAAGLDLTGSTSYAYDTLKSRNKPNRVTWFLWSLAPLVAFSAQLGKGVGWQSLLTFVVGFGPLLVFIASLINKKAVWQISSFDYICGGLSLLGLTLWIITREGNFAIAMSIVADLLAALPTVVKAFRAPESESARVFIMGAIASVITLLTIHSWTFETYAFPLYILIICLLLFSLIRFKLGKRFSSRELDIPKTF